MRIFLSFQQGSWQWKSLKRQATKCLKLLHTSISWCIYDWELEWALVEPDEASEWMWIGVIGKCVFVLLSCPSQLLALIVSHRFSWRSGCINNGEKSEKHWLEDVYSGFNFHQGIDDFLWRMLPVEDWWMKLNLAS